MKLTKILLVVLIISNFNYNILNATVWNTAKEYIHVRNMFIEEADVEKQFGRELNIKAFDFFLNGTYIDYVSNHSSFNYISNRKCFSEEYGCGIGLESFFNFMFLKTPEAKSLNGAQEIASATDYLVHCFYDRMIDKGYVFEDDSMEVFDRAKKLFIDEKLAKNIFLQ